MGITKALVRKLFGKAALTTAALSGLVFLAAAPAAKADDCAKRIRKAEHNLQEAIEDHGYYSRKADHWRHELREAYQRCDRYGSGYRDRDGGWYDRDGRYHDRDDYRYDRDRD
jgi:hypothetical protein